MQPKFLPAVHLIVLATLEVLDQHLHLLSLRLAVVLVAAETGLVVPQTCLLAVQTMPAVGLAPVPVRLAALLKAVGLILPVEQPCLLGMLLGLTQTPFVGHHQ